MKKLAPILLALMVCLSACGNDDFAGGPGTDGEADNSTAVASLEEGASWEEPSQPEESDPPGESSHSVQSEESEEGEKSASSTSFVHQFSDGVEYRVPMDEPYRFAPEEYQGVWETMRLVDVDGSSLTAVPEDGEMLTFATPQAWAFTGDISRDIQELRPGMTVRVGYDGYVMETWPGQITADYLIVEEYDGGLMEAYRDILEEALDPDSALNADVDYFGFDLASAPQLSVPEAEALGWLFASAHGMEAVYGTIEELGEQGYIDMENLYWEDGVHFTLQLVEGAKSSDTEFSLECVKWRSGLGAVWLQSDLQKRNGQWEHSELRMTAIS